MSASKPFIPYRYPKNTHRHPRLRKLGIAFLSLCVLIATGVVVMQIQNNRAITADRARFAQAEKDQKELRQQILSNAGPTAGDQFVTSCSIPSYEYFKTPISCSVTNRIAYEVQNLEDANAKHEMTLKIIESQKNYKKIKSSKKEISLSSNNEPQTSIDEYSIANDMHCSMIFNYFLTEEAPFDYKKIFNFQSSQAVVIIIQCGDEAKDQHYPLIT